MHEDLCGFQLGYVSVWTRKGSGSLIPPHLSLHPCAHSLLSTRQNLHLMALERFYSALPLNGCTLKKTFVLLSALLSWPFLNSSSFPFSFFFFFYSELSIFLEMVDGICFKEILFKDFHFFPSKKFSTL